MANSAASAEPTANHAPATALGATLNTSTTSNSQLAKLELEKGSSSNQGGHDRGAEGSELPESFATKEAEPVTQVVPTEDEEAEEDDRHFVKGPARIFLAFALCVTTFLIGLDQMIIATAIPKITTQFHSLDDVGWYGSAYLLCTTALQPSFGKIYTYFNVKWTFVAALVVFEVGSIVCAVAKDSISLIIGRAVAGAGSAGLFSGGMTMIGYAMPLRHRAIYLAALSSMFGVASIVGPILGGAFTDRLTWRWCFWINLPFGALAVFIVIFTFKNPERDFTHVSMKQKIKEMDFVGAFFLISAIICLLLALQWGGITYAWNDSRVWGCMLGFGLIIIVFIFTQIRAKDQATIPLRIMKNRTITAAALTLSFLSMGIYTHVFYLPFYFQAVKGTTAEQSGIRCIAYLISNTIGAIFIGGIVTVVGYYSPFIWAGTALFTVGSGLLFTLKVDSSRGVWIGYQILAGFGCGGAVQLPFIATQVVLSPKDMPTGNAIAIFFNTLGGAIAISIAQNIFSNTLIKELKHLVPSVNPATILLAGATHIREVVKPEELPGTLEAYDLAVTRAFVLPIAAGGLAFLSSLLFEWRSVKGKKIIPAGGA
ncbi:MFS general substrate transporter [Trichodelitschia bisporula]|uniref:MFS general substrate transporter n=1 Tax=Trichodelitschia bisporula TaxID=703511 RepID=A0A6G1HZG1_9PEZI|nr:MFS general substrate transporter [Trichodelitschia bisporula]